MMIKITMFCVVFVTYLCSSRLTRNMSPVDATSTPLQHHHSSYQDDATLMRIRIKIKMMFMKRWWMVIIKPWLRKPSSDKKENLLNLLTWTRLRTAFGRQSPEWIVGFYFILFFSEGKWWLTRAPNDLSYGTNDPKPVKPTHPPLIFGARNPLSFISFGTFNVSLLNENRIKCAIKQWFLKVWDHLVFVLCSLHR